MGLLVDGVWTEPGSTPAATQRSIMNHESSQIIRMFNSTLITWTPGGDFSPPPLREEIDTLNERLIDFLTPGGLEQRASPVDRAARSHRSG
jgi:glutathionyl-hydroquinone reductase